MDRRPPDQENRSPSPFEEAPPRTKWSVICGNILDISADALLCSANPHLNLSGGIGGAFLLRYGTAMQTFLHDYLRGEKQSVVPPGSVVLAPASGSPYRIVAHAVAIDVFYGTDCNRIVATYHRAFTRLAEYNCKTVAAACLGCGYGRCPTEEFLKAIQQTIVRHYPPLRQIQFVTTDEELACRLTEVIESADQ